MVFARKIATRIQPYFGYRSRNRLVLTARALRSARPGFGEGSRWRAFRTMMAQFASREVAGVTVQLVVEGPDGPLVDRTATTDREGFVHFDIALDPAWDLPDHPMWEVATLRWINGNGPQIAEAHILAPGRDSSLAVISDVDDTIVETGITGGVRNIARNWKRVLAQLPHQRVAVPGAEIFYNHLGGGEKGSLPQLGAQRMTATHRPFFYVSSSPWNLFSYLVAFQRANNMPLGPLLLRDWGFNRETLGSGSHGVHKQAAIGSLLEMYPAMRFALIGDDTQGDLPAFADAVARHPGRVAAVFLRMTAGEEFTREEHDARATIEAAGVPLWLGETFEEGRDFLARMGFSEGGETEQIVRMVEHAAAAEAGGAR